MKENKLSSVFFIFVLSGVFLLNSGCTVLVKENRYLLNKLDTTIKIESTTGKIVATPVFIPVGTLAGLFDVVIIHPIASIPKASDDTYKYLWENPSGSDFRQMMLVVPKLVFTPLYFSGDLITRSLVPVY